MSLNEEIDRILNEATPQSSASNAGGDKKQEDLKSDDPASKEQKAGKDTLGDGEDDKPVINTTPAPKRKGDQSGSDDPTDPPTGVKPEVKAVDPHTGKALSEEKDGDEEDEDDEKEEMSEGKSCKKEEADEDEEEEMEESVDLSDLNLEEDIAALTAGQENLSEEFKNKTRLMVEAVVRQKITEQYQVLRERLEERYETKLNEAKEEYEATLSEKADAYLSHVAETFMEENKLAIDNGLRNEMAESFMDGLKNLFNEHYVEMPKGKEDILAQLSERVEALTGDVDKLLVENKDLKSQVRSQTKNEIIEEAVDGLSDVKADKIRSLAEHVAFENEDSFREKIETIKESYTSSPDASSSVQKPQDLHEDTNSLEDVVEDDNDEMSIYTSTLRRISTAPKQS